MVVPNVTPVETSITYRQMCHVLRTTSMKAWEKQAVKFIVRVVRSTLHTMQIVFNKFSMKKGWSLARP